MRILTVSDEVVPMLYDHFNPSSFPGIDLILSCGDLPAEYLSFLVTVFNVPLFYVRGNHDIGYESNLPNGCIDLHAKVVDYRGVRLLGLEGSNWYNGGPVQYTERQMRRIVRRARWRIWLKGGIDVVISHVPPRHIHDAENPCHRGFKCFRGVIDRYAPSFFIHGHIHTRFENEAQRFTIVRKTRVVNTFGHTIINAWDGRGSDHGKII
jgi:Icc-related predicted phosphoesterase